MRTNYPALPPEIEASAFREECVSDNLSGLTALDAVVGAEVRAVLRVARLRLPRFGVDAAAVDTRDHPASVEPLDEDPERRVREDIGERLPGRRDRLIEASPVRDYLRNLPSSGESVSAEVRSVVDVARLRLTGVRVDPTARIATHHPARGKALDEDVEGIGRRYVSVSLTSDRLLETCGVGNHLGNLPSNHTVFRAEVAILVSIARLRLTSLRVDPTALVAGDDATAGEALDIGVEGVGRRDVGVDVDTRGSRRYNNR